MYFAFRHPVYCVTNPRKAWATRKAMEAYRKRHPVCEFSGRAAGCHIHHIESIQFAPHKAADQSNFITLHGKHVHLVVGHAGNYKQCVENVREICDGVRIIKQKKGEKASCGHQHQD